MSNQGHREKRGDQSARPGGSGDRPGGPGGGTGASGGAVLAVVGLLVAAIVAVVAWWVLDPAERIERLCYSVDQVVDLAPAG